MNTLPEMRALVRAILEHPFSYTWSVQGMGFMRTYLNGRETRLHIWDDMLRKPNVSMIHNHPWDFTSTVTSGVLVQWRYTMLMPTPFSEPLPFVRAQIKAGAGAYIEPGTEVDIFLYRDAVETYETGQRYSQLKNEIHETCPVNGTTTVVRRSNFNEDPDHANVFWLKGQQFVDAAPRQASREQIERVTARALERWF